MNIDRANKNWNNQISDEEILNREFTCGFLIHSNQHLDVFKQLKEMVLSTYTVRAVFTHLGYNGDTLYCNGQRLVWRKTKFSDFQTGKNVNIIKHNLSHKGGGSHKHPSVGYKGCEIELEFISYGLPYVDSINGWGIHVISIN